MPLREPPGAWNEDETQEMAQRISNGVAAMGSDVDIEWVKSFVTDTALVDIFNAPHENVLRAHASLVGIPPGEIFIVRSEIGP